MPVTNEEISRELHRLQTENRVLMQRISFLEIALLDMAKTAAKRVVIESIDDDSDDTSEEFDELNPFKEDDDDDDDDGDDEVRSDDDAIDFEPERVMCIYSKKDKKRDEEKAIT